jgi:hypothetical protein
MIDCSWLKQLNIASSSYGVLLFKVMGGEWKTITPSLWWM